MELVHVRQVPFESLSEERIDVLLLACSGKKDSNTVLPTFLLSARRKIIMVFCDEAINRADFPQEAEVVHFQTDTDINNIRDMLETLCHIYQGDNVKLVIDYTHMHKSILGAIVSFLSLNEFTCNRLTVYFYCAGNSVPEPTLPSSGPVLQPILIYENYKFNQRPIALIVELNSLSMLEQVNELHHTFCPSQMYFFIPSELGYQSQTVKLERYKTAKTIEYNSQDIESLDETLRLLCRQLRLEYRVVVVSMGSKVFSMVAFLINARYPDVEVWQYGPAAWVESPVAGSEDKYVYCAILSDDFIEDVPKK
ncbi:MAG: hypothetical protein ACP5PZ_03545 [Bacteroidales bacterium]